MAKYYKRINLQKPTLRKMVAVDGRIHQDHKGVRFAVIDVVASCDEKGKFISFSNEVEGVTLQVPVEMISDLLEEVIAW